MLSDPFAAADTTQPKDALKMLVVGDSISVGVGILGNRATCKSRPSNRDESLTYAALTAEALEAELYVVAVPGKGVVQNYDGKQNNTMLDLLGYRGNSPHSRWDFRNHSWDIIVVHLGTNDFGSDVTSEDFDPGYLALLTQLKSDFPDAKLITAIGPMLGPNKLVRARKSIEAISEQLGAKFVFFAKPEEPGHWGCGYHPNVSRHRMMADTLIQALDE